jgi:hypothetical protein
MTQATGAARLLSRPALLRPESRQAAFWQEFVLSRVAAARYDLRIARAATAEPAEAWTEIEDLLGEAERAARRPGSPMWVRRYGGAVNRAFVRLHAAQVLLARHQPDERLGAKLDSAMARVRATMPAGPRRQDLERRYTKAVSCTGADGVRRRQDLLEKALEWSYNTTDAQYAHLRSFRNIVWGMALVVLCVAVGLSIMGLAWEDSLQLCFRPDEDEPPACPLGSTPTGRDALVIQALGAAGGALAAVLTVRGMQDTPTPYAISLALAAMKLPLGALTALLGLLLIHGQFVPGLTDLDNSGQILAYAVILGIAQQAVTMFLDQRGRELLDRIPTKRGGPVGEPAPR